MVIHGVYIVSKSGGLIFNHDNNTPRVETEKVFNYPIDLRLEYEAKKVSVAFGQKDGINGNYHKKNSKMMALLIEISMKLLSKRLSRPADIHLNPRIFLFIH